MNSLKRHRKQEQVLPATTSKVSCTNLRSAHKPHTLPGYTLASQHIYNQQPASCRSKRHHISTLAVLHGACLQDMSASHSSKRPLPAPSSCNLSTVSLNTHTTHNQQITCPHNMFNLLACGTSHLLMYTQFSNLQIDHFQVTNATQ